MKMIKPGLLAATLALPCLLSHSPCSQAASSSTNEKRVLAALKKAHPGTPFTAVSRTPITGLYEVWMGPNVAFVSDSNLRYLVFGHLFDTRSMTDLTQPKLAQHDQTARMEDDDAAPTMPIGQFPLTDAIDTVHGNGGDASRHLVVFSDPACPYCKRLEPELDKLDNVTIHTFLVPFQGTALPTAVWCAPDRRKAWHQAMHGEQDTLAQAAAAIAPSCAHPLDRNLALAQRLKIQGTPTIFYANGRRTDGYADTAEIEAQINAAPRKTSSSPSTASQKEPTP